MALYYCLVLVSHTVSSHIRQCFIRINEVVYKSLIGKASVDWLLSEVHLHKRDHFTNHLKLIVPAHNFLWNIHKKKSTQKKLS